ncbi:MAG: Sec-independent protein translocase subunit TatB [Pseudomonadota bacterium]|jgi:sec-independent protein translocase protein TatB
MFDIGFSEILIIAIVALVVIGPERLPRVARTVGHLIGRFQRYATQVKSDISREMQLEDLKKMQAEVAAAASNLQTSITSEMAAVQSQVNETAQEVESQAKENLEPLDAGRLEAAAHDVEREMARMEAELSRSYEAEALASHDTAPALVTREEDPSVPRPTTPPPPRSA